MGNWDLCRIDSARYKDLQLQKKVCCPGNCCLGKEVPFGRFLIFRSKTLMTQNESLWLTCILKEAQDLRCFIFLQYKSFYLSILDDLKILWALSTHQEPGLHWKSRGTLRCPHRAPRKSRAGSWLRLSCSTSSSTAKCREKAAVLFIVICICTVPRSPALGYAGKQRARRCTNAEQTDETNGDMEKQSDGSRWHVSSWCAALQGWPFPLYQQGNLCAELRDCNKELWRCSKYVVSHNKGHGGREDKAAFVFL